jgi:hypothetical protein
VPCSTVCQSGSARRRDTSTSNLGLTGLGQKLTLEAFYTHSTANDSRWRDSAVLYLRGPIRAQSSRGLTKSPRSPGFTLCGINHTHEPLPEWRTTPATIVFINIAGNTIRGSGRERSMRYSGSRGPRTFLPSRLHRHCLVLRLHTSVPESPPVLL